jgi:hypothetical protein
MAAYQETRTTLLRGLTGTLLRWDFLVFCKMRRKIFFYEAQWLSNHVSLNWWEIMK